MKKIGITGESGFIGTNLKNFLKDKKEIEIIPFEDYYFKDKLEAFVKKCDTLVHLAGMNRGTDEEVYNTNIELAKKLVESLAKQNQHKKVIYASTTQTKDPIKKNTAYGKGKMEAGAILDKWAKENKQSLTVLIIPNVYGPGCKPYYNSAIATFCHQLTHNEEPEITGNPTLPFIYVNDLCKFIYEKVQEEKIEIKEEYVKETEKASIEEILMHLKHFKESYINNKIVPELKDHFILSLFNTFRSYIDNPLIELEKKEDHRGYLFEIVKHPISGQVFFSTTKPGVIRGNHYHTRKIERFCVVKGKAVIRLRKINTDKIIEFHVSGDKPTFIDMPTYYTHHIENTGSEELNTIFWISEIYKPDDHDTFYEEV